MRLVICLLLASASMACHAQAWYLVELIVFNNTDPSALTTERWRSSPGLPDTASAVPLALGSDRVRPMGPSVYRLAGVWQRLRDSGQYRPVRHLAWRQPGTSTSRAPIVQVGEDPDGNVFGTVKVSRSKFLHMELDLLVRDGDGSYRVQTRRKMSANELHYIDHPLVGILARVSPY